MNPTDFLKLADTLVADQSEAHQRSAVSRAYYAAFNAAKTLIESCGLRFPRAAEVHEKVAWCMDETGDQELKVARGKLNSLRMERNAADYQLEDKRFQKKGHAALQLGIAKQIATAIAAAEARKTAFSPKVKAFAKNTLKLTAN